MGKNVLPGRWTYNVVEEYDDSYSLVFREYERTPRDKLMLGRRHVYEAEMRAREQASD